MDLQIIFDAMTEGQRCHMANKLFKEGYVPIKLQKQLNEALKALEESEDDL